jgi:hypothetical protein
MSLHFVVPAQAGTQSATVETWTPACAGATPVSTPSQGGAKS